MTAAVLAGFAGVLLSLLLSYVPKFGPWFNALANDRKVMINGVLLVLVSAGAYGLGCAGLAPALHLAVSCDTPGLITMLGALLSALMANQVTYTAFVRPFVGANADN